MHKHADQFYPQDDGILTVSIEAFLYHDKDKTVLNSSHKASLGLGLGLGWELETNVMCMNCNSFLQK